MKQKGSPENNGKSACGEMTTKEALRAMGANVEEHFVWEGGLDIKGNLGSKTIGGEVWN